MVCGWFTSGLGVERDRANQGPCVDLPRGLAGAVLYSQALETANCRLSEVQSQVIQ
jgi:hypothetical protein